MKIIKPKVELWEQGEELDKHILRCARICYRRESGNDEALMKNLFKKHHYSMFRHASYYYVIPYTLAPVWIRDYIVAIARGAKIIGIDIKRDKDNILVVTNGNWGLDHQTLVNSLLDFQVSEKEFINISEVAFNMRRLTFKVITQISTSRELNRVSPNNIAEQSTRYVYEDGTICKPHWLEGYDIFQTLHGKYLIYKDGKEDDDINYKVLTYINQCDSAFNTYKYLVDAGLSRQDARGVLPLDTATRCVYTYSWSEWEEIIKKRVYNTTGKTHPNATIICKLIEQELNSLGYEVNIES